MIRFEDIVERVERYHPEADLDLLKRAYVFSAMEHRNQHRKSGEPYLIHPLEVAWILADLRLDLTTVAVGLLHDVLEDTLTTREVLLEYFGAEVTSLVEGVSKIDVSFEKLQAVVSFDDAKTNVPALTKATADVGFPSTAKQ